MKNLLIVFKFELLNYFRNKAFRISTIILCLLVFIGLSVPTLMEAFGRPIFNKYEVKGSKEDINGEILKSKYGVLINTDAINKDELQSQLPGSILLYPENEEELKDMVMSSNVKAGFIVNNETSYKYLVVNTSASQNDRYIFENAMLNLYRDKALSEQGIDSVQVSQVYLVPMEYEIDALGKDGKKNYAYTYILIFALYFIVLFYGQITATSVASEKSNRSMEILVTITGTESLMFGKVLAGATAGILQFATVILVAFLAYMLNIKAWDSSLDFIFNIPMNILGTFAIFAILGYLLFLFIFGAIGALVSRTEDVGVVSAPIMIIFIAAFFISMIGLTNPDMFALKIASYIPFTSFMAMFVRVSMGNVSNPQVFISLSLLAITTFITGIFGAKIYRLGTLMYGDPVKLTRAFKLMRNK